MQNEEAVQYLSSLLGKTLRILISDRRVFVGKMKCTDRDRNIVLANAHELREPTGTAPQATAANVPNGSGKVSMAMAERFVGLIVVPGEHILRIELVNADASAED